MIFEKTERIDIGLQFEGLSLDPVLCKGFTLPNFNLFGNTPVTKE